MSNLQQLAINLGLSYSQVIAFVIILLILAIWSAIWKALALWKSARRNELVWFIVFLIFNTLGILEILYIYAFSRQKARKRA